MAFVRKCGGCFRLVETYRDNGKVRQRYLVTLGRNATPEAALAAYRESLERHPARRAKLLRRIEVLQSYMM